MFGDNWEEARIIPPILGPNIQGSWIIITDQWQRLERPPVSWGLKSKTCRFEHRIVHRVPTEWTGGGWHLTSAPWSSCVLTGLHPLRGRVFFAICLFHRECCIKFICSGYFTKMLYKPLFMLCMTLIKLLILSETQLSQVKKRYSSSSSSFWGLFCGLKTESETLVLNRWLEFWW